MAQKMVEWMELYWASSMAEMLENLLAFEMVELLVELLECSMAVKWESSRAASMAAYRVAGRDHA